MRLILLFTVVFSSFCFAETSYTAIPLNKVSSTHTEYYPSLILSDGTVVGTVYKTSGPIAARSIIKIAQFSPDSQTLTYAPSTLGGRNLATLYHVNATGDVLGYYFDENTQRYRSFIWRANDAIDFPEHTMRSILSIYYTPLLGLGSNDEIFGARSKSKSAGSFNAAPFCVNCSDNISLDNEFPVDMNSSGNFVGVKGNLDAFRKFSAFAFYNGQITDFSGVLPDEVRKSGFAYDINESNKALITTGNVGVLKRPSMYLFDLQSSEFTKISPSFLKKFGTITASKQSLNSCDQLIYSVSNFENNKTAEQRKHAFLWSESNGEVNINDLITDKASLRGYKITRAIALSDSGHILVEGTRTIKRSSAVKIRCGCGGGADRELLRFFLLSPSEISTCN